MWNRTNKKAFKFAFTSSVVILFTSFLIEPVTDILRTNLSSVSVIRAAIDVKDLDLCKQHVDPTSEIRMDSTQTRDYRNPSIPAGMSAWLAGDCEKAADYWSKYSQENDKNISARFWTLVASANIGWSNNEVSKDLGSQFTEFTILKLEAAFKNDDHDEANIWFLIAATYYPEESAKALYRIAWEFYKIGKGNLAAEYLQLFNGYLTQKSPRRQITLGLASRFVGNPALSIQYFEDGLKLEPDNRELLSNLRSILVDSGNFERGLLIAFREAELVPDDDQSQAEIRLTIGRIYRYLADYKNSKIWTLMAIEANSNWWPIYEELGTVHCSAGDMTDAMFYYDRAAELARDHPFHLNIIKSKINCLHRQGRFLQAARESEDVISRYGDDPGLIRLYLDLGEWYEDARDDGNAIDLYRKGLEIWPNYDVFEIRLQSLAEETSRRDDR